MTDIQQSSIRELSLDEIDSVGGGKGFWGKIAHGFEGFAKDVDHGAILGGVTGAVGGAVLGDGVGAIPGAAGGIVVGAAGGAATWALGELHI